MAGTAEFLMLLEWHWIGTSGISMLFIILHPQLACTFCIGLFFRFDDVYEYIYHTRHHFLLFVI